jgi:NitT/TauT family transport system ATP-binding protein
MVADTQSGAGVQHAGPDARPLIKIDRLSKIYSTQTGDVEAVSDISLGVGRGEFVALLGPSGCGKSTMLMMVAGLLQPTAGQVRIGGKTVNGAYTDLGIVFQNHVLLEWRTTLQNVLFQTDMRHVSRRETEPRARSLLSQVGLAGFEEKYPHELSGGMRQRAAICRALVHDPPILLMDEPFGALDALTREQLRIDLEKLWLENHKTVLFVTHSIAEAVQLADRVVVITARPGRVQRIIQIDLPRPRYERAADSPQFAHLSAEIKDLFLAQGVLRT